jgi:2'-5' RNA ligase
MADKEGAPTIRAFVALDLDTTSVRRVARIADRLRMGSGAPSASWTPPDKMHVTLKFVASLQTASVAALGKALAVLAGERRAPQPCPLRLDAFPSMEAAKIVVAELDDASGALAKLAERVDKLVAKHGVERETRPFRPHVTLARLKRPYDARRWIRPDLAEGAGDCRIECLTLYRSELGELGSTYVPLARFAFVDGSGASAQ